MKNQYFNEYFADQSRAGRKTMRIALGLLALLVMSIPFAVQAQEFDDGRYYRLTTQWQGDGKSLDVVNDGANDKLILADTGDYSGQHWRVERQANGHYRLTTQWQGAGKSLDVVNDGANNQLRLAPTGDYSGQYWKIVAQ